MMILAVLVWALLQAGAVPEILRAVQQQIQEGDLAGARDRLLRGVKQHPDEPNIHNLLGVVEAQQGNYEAAEAHFLRAIRLAPRSEGTHLNLGRLYQENAGKDGQALKKALETYRKLLGYSPANVEANYQSAVLLANLGEFRASLEHLARLPQVSQQRAQTLAVACADYAGLGDFSRAGDLADRLLAGPDLTEADVLSILPALERGRSDDLEIRLLEGIDGRKLASPETLYRLALLYERRQQLEQARETFERVAGRSSPTAELLQELARVAYKQRDHRGALGYLAHARDLKPDHPGIHFFFGMVCVELNLGAEAYQSLSRAVSLEPGNLFYNYAMGAVALERRDPAEAIPYFRKYHDLKPEDPRGRLLLGVAYLESADLGAARTELEQAVKHRETQAGAWFYLARLARQEGKVPEALEAVEKAIELNPDHTDALAELGLLRYRQREYELSEKVLRRALEIDPDNYAANFNLLMLYRRIGDKRAEAQAERFEEVKNKRDQKTRDFLRLIEVRPFDP